MPQWTLQQHPAPPQQCRRNKVSCTAALCESDEPHKCLCVHNWNWYRMWAHFCVHTWGVLTRFMFLFVYNILLMCVCVREREKETRRMCRKVFALISEWEWGVGNDNTVKIWFFICYYSLFKTPCWFTVTSPPPNLTLKISITDTHKQNKKKIKTQHNTMA